MSYQNTIHDTGRGLSYHHRAPLSPQQLQEIELARHAGLVRYVAAKYFKQTPEEDREDLLAEGRIGLLKAVNTFDAGRGVKFSTYAARVIWSEMMHFRERQQRLSMYKAEVDESDPSDSGMRRPLSLNAPLVAASAGDPGASTIGDTLKDTTADTASAALEPMIRKQFWKDIAASFPIGDQCRAVVRAHYLCGIDTKTIAAAMGVSDRRVNEIKLTAIRRIRARLKAPGFAEQLLL